MTNLNEMTLIQVGKELDRLGYNIESENVSFELFKPSDSYISSKAIITFSVSTIPYCCGIAECGDFTFSLVDDLPLNIKELFIAYVLIKLAGAKSTAKIKKYMPTIIVSNGLLHWKTVEKVLEKLVDYYKLANISRNPSTTNILKMYISK